MSLCAYEARLGSFDTQHGRSADAGSRWWGAMVLPITRMKETPHGTTAQTRPAPLTEAQRAVLTSAAARAEGAVILPARLKGKAAETLAQALLDNGLVREIRSKGEMPVWRKDESTGRSFTLVLTKAGWALVAEPAVDGQEQPAPVASSAPASASSADRALPRANSNLAGVIALLGRDRGSSVTELMAATGWLPHTTRAALTGLHKRGYALTREAAEGGSVYRIVQASAGP